LKAGNYAQAVALFTRALSSGKLSHSDMEFAYTQRGTAYLRQGKNGPATLDFKKALAIDPGDQDAKDGLSEAQSNGGGSAPAGRHSSAAAQQIAGQGMAALNAGNGTEATRLFTEVIDQHALGQDDTELAYLSRGKAYILTGDYHDAVPDFEQALRMKPDDQEALQGLATALGHVHATAPIAGIDRPACDKNFVTNGWVTSGKSYTSFGEYPSLSRIDAFAGLYAALAAHTPVPGQNWSITGANLNYGTITGTITSSDGRSMTLDALVQPEGVGSKVTMTEKVPGFFATIDLRGSLCHTLMDVSK
jgi:tetratricopeptide (TPR) repeat protein